MRLACGKFMSRVDQLTFAMLIDCLKSSDQAVVIDTLALLEKEKKQLAIPPVYFLSRAHPLKKIRQKALETFAVLDQNGEARKIVEGKSTEFAVKELIEKYGNFRSA